MSLVKDRKTLVLYLLHDPDNPVELAFQQRYGHIATYEWSVVVVVVVVVVVSVVVFFASCGPNYAVVGCWTNFRLQRHFPIVDILFHSRDIRDRRLQVSEIAPKFDVFRPPNFRGQGPQILGPSF